VDLGATIGRAQAAVEPTAVALQQRQDTALVGLERLDGVRGEVDDQRECDRRRSDDGLGFDLDAPARSSRAETAIIVAAGRTSPKTAPCTAPTESASAGSTRNIRVRTTSRIPAPASVSAASMIAKQRRAWRPASSGHEPSGNTGPVPETRTRSPTRTAREKPMVGSKGEPEEMRRRGEASIR
jgi:hypothetical protein